MKIAITGYPNSGKSTLADLLHLITGAEVMRTDSLLDTHDWSELSQAVSEWFEIDSDWIIEGVAVPRALRKWHARHPFEAPPFDIFVFMRRPHINYRPGQRAMANGMDTVMLELWSWLRHTDVTIVKFGDSFMEQE
jgi:broad-specificity NMP kinase